MIFLSTQLPELADAGYRHAALQYAYVLPPVGA
jgi:hypothetical protein